MDTQRLNLIRSSPGAVEGWWQLLLWSLKALRIDCYQGGELTPGVGPQAS
jgi:hypothetical protein